MRRLVLSASPTLALLPEASAQAENWPQWRGSAFNACANDKGLPLNWSQMDNGAYIGKP